MSNLPATFEARVKAKINESIGELIPEEQLGEMVSAQVRHFISHDLQAAIKETIRARMAEAINVALTSPEYTPQFNQFGVDGAGAAVKKVMTENANEIFANAFGGMAQQVVNIMRQQRPY